MYNPLVGGMGLGVVVNQKLYTGSNGVAGEIFSRIPSLQKIIRDIQEEQPDIENFFPAGKNIADIQIADLYNYSKKDCPLSTIVLARLSKLVAKEISKITGLFDPERITLGGDLSICENLCCNEIAFALRDLLSKHYPFKIQIPQIQYARSKIFSAAIGASALYLSDELAL